MRVARWGRVRAGRPSTEASERDGGGRRASRWRPGDPAMRLRRRVDMVTAGEQGAWRNRHRLPGGGCRLSRDVGALEVPNAKKGPCNAATPPRSRKLAVCSRVASSRWSAICSGLHQLKVAARRLFAFRAAGRPRASQVPVERGKSPRGRPVGWVRRERELGRRGRVSGSSAARRRRRAAGTVVGELFKPSPRGPLTQFCSCG